MEFPFHLTKKILNFGQLGAEINEQEVFERPKKATLTKLKNLDMKNFSKFLNETSQNFKLSSQMDKMQKCDHWGQGEVKRRILKTT